MKKSMLFGIKQFLKMGLQNVILPTVYAFWRMVYRKKAKDLIICADAHHDAMPFSMAYMYRTLKDSGYCVQTDICDYRRLSAAGSALRAIRFMKAYARARVVFICDNFLPVVSCRKDPRTKVVQLMHSCGLGKKIGYDAVDDIPAGYRGHVYRNYDLVTVTSPLCVEPVANSMHHTADVVRAIGSSRTDFYFDDQWIQACRDAFYAAYPHAAGKKVVLWVPTFRGNAADPEQVGTEEIARLEAELGGDYVVIRKVHPHVDRKYHLSDCTIPAEQLLPVADLVITDYSSIVVDYMFFGKPYVIFAPDWQQYRQQRGMYVDPAGMTPYMVVEGAALRDTVLQALETPADWVAEQRERYLSACDGRSTARIMEYLGL